MKTGKGPYMQKAGRGNMEKTGANPRMGALMYGGPHQEKTEDYKVNDAGQQVAVRDTATGDFYQPSEAGLAAAKKIGSKPREFKGAIYGFDQQDRAPGYKTADGKMLRANNPRELKSLQEQYKRDLSIHNQQENRRVDRGNIARGYAGNTINN